MTSLRLTCPHCNAESSYDEWSIILRHVVSTGGAQAINVLRHRACRRLTYFLVK